jgi:hypothetical protein
VQYTIDTFKIVKEKLDNGEYKAEELANVEVDK